METVDVPVPKVVNVPQWRVDTVTENALVEVEGWMEADVVRQVRLALCHCKSKSHHPSCYTPSSR